MESVFRVCLFIAGVINFLPSVLFFLPDKVGSAYGIIVPDANYELLLRHRAVLFGIVGGILIFSALLRQYYSLSVTIGLVSMLTFILLFYWVKGEVNAELTKVMRIDVAGSAILLLGYGLYRFF